MNNPTMAVFSPIRWSHELIDYLERHREELETLIAVYVVEADIVRHWARTWSAEGWVGQEAGRTVVETILADFEQRADAFFQRVERALGKPVRRVVLTGDFVPRVLALAKAEQVGRIVMVRRVRPRWLRRWMQTEGERIAREACCEVVSIEPER